MGQDLQSIKKSSTEQQAEAWMLVCSVLKELDPNWTRSARNGMLAAVNTIRRFAARADVRKTFQDRVMPWMHDCFGPIISANKKERNHRFLEEALELVQSLGCTREECLRLVDYVYNRPEGVPKQEVGGVMVTLAALCLANGLDMHVAGDDELARISDQEVMEKIRKKQASKRSLHDPLPGGAPGEGANFRHWYVDGQLVHVGETYTPRLEDIHKRITSVPAPSNPYLPESYVANLMDASVTKKLREEWLKGDWDTLGEICKDEDCPHFGRARCEPKPAIGCIAQKEKD